MENFRGVKWNRSPLAFGILVDHMTAALARDRTLPLLRCFMIKALCLPDEFSITTQHRRACWE
jgi:hypothetical protein